MIRGKWRGRIDFAQHEGGEWCETREWTLELQFGAPAALGSVLVGRLRLDEETGRWDVIEAYCGCRDVEGRTIATGQTLTGAKHALEARLASLFVHGMTLLQRERAARMQGEGGAA